MKDGTNKQTQQILWWDFDEKDFMKEEDNIISNVLGDVEKFKDLMSKFYNNCYEYELIYQKRTNARSDDSDIDDYYGTTLQVDEKTPVYNVVRMNIDTIHNKISKVRPKITFLTKDKDSDRRALAKKLDLYCLNQFKKGDVWRVGRSAFKDALISDLGIVKIFVKKGQTKFRKIHPRKFFCSNPFFGNHSPNYAGEYDMWKVYELLDAFPKSSKEIKKHYEDYHETIMVYEVFMSNKKHIIFTDEMILLYEDWKYDFVPYQPIVYSQSTEGVVGFGITNEIISMQLKINYMLNKISKSARLLSNPKVAVHKSSGLTDEDINNELGAILEYTEVPPTFLTPPIFNEQYFGFLESLYTKCLHNTGTNMISASGKVPSSLTSGQAIMNYQDVNSERVATVIQGYEEMFIDIARKMVLMNPPKEIKQYTDGMSLNDVLMTELQVYPTNLLPEEPAGQVQTLANLMEQGIVSPDEALSMIDSPDIRRFVKSKSARIDAIHLMIEEALDANEDIVTDEVLGIDLQLDIARRKYAELITEMNYDKNADKLLLLKTFIDGIIAEQRAEQQRIMQAQIDAQKQAQMQGQGQGQGGQPQQPLPPTGVNEALGQQ